jgi:hypothetical protein
LVALRAGAFFFATFLTTFFAAFFFAAMVCDVFDRAGESATDAIG